MERKAANRGTSISIAHIDDVASILAIRTAMAHEMTHRHGRGHWSSCPTEKAILRELRSSRVLVARRTGQVVGTVRMEARKPWAIDVSSFTRVSSAVYLHALAVAPLAQRQGIGSRLVEEAKHVARAWPSGAIRLDAYDHPAGAGPFYRRCGFSEVGRIVYRGVPLVYYEFLL